MVMEARIKTEFWVKALIRRCAMEGAMAMIARKGEPSAGAVLVKVNSLDGMAYVLSQSIDMDGKTIWLRVSGEEDTPEAKVEEYVTRSVARDPDIWVVEIEDREGRHFLTEPVEGEGSRVQWPQSFQ